MLGWRRLAVRRRVVVNLKAGGAIRGILWSQRGGLLELRHAEVLDEGARATPAAGSVIVERSNVDFVQVPEV